MRNTIFVMAFALVTLSASSSNNDFGAEEDSVTNDTFYYSGCEKIKLFHHPSKIAVFDFNTPDNEENCVKKVMQKIPGVSCIKQIGDKHNNFRITAYDVNQRNSFQLLPDDSNIKIFPCYTIDTGLELAADGYIDVKLRHPEDVVILKQLADNYKCEFLGNHNTNYPLWNVLRITSETELSPITIANEIYETGFFEWSMPDFSYFNAYEISYDPDINKQWGLYNAEDNACDIDISEAWGYSTGRGIKIAIIDDGIDSSNEDLKGNISNLSYDAVTEKSPCAYFDADGHGTHCAGIAAAIRNNNLNVSGVAPDAEIMPIRISLNDGGTREQIVNAINWAVKNGADILSCSWECSEDILIKDAIIDALYKGRNGKGCIVVKSAGNNGKKGGKITFPGNFNHDVISVGAIKKNGIRDEDSSWGEYMFVCAPGNNILSTMPGNKTGYGTGTSTAAPHVAGVAALILSRNPSLTMRQVRQIIGSNTNDISPESQTRKEFGMWDSKYGYGLVNALQCVKATPRR